MSGQVSLFNCRIDAVTMQEALDAIERWIATADGICRYVVTPNVHHAVLLQHHADLRQAYADASLVLADGVPLLLAARLMGRRLPERVAGSDLVPALFDRCRNRRLRVYLLGAAEGVADRAARRIEQRWPDVKVVGTCTPPLRFERDPGQNAAILARVLASRPDVLLVGLGAPKQEAWVHSHRRQIAAPVALCIGATIDFLAGHKPRAPRWMQRSGLEWLHRIATEPRRLLPRYVHDACVYPWLVCREVFRGRVFPRLPADDPP